MSLEEVTFEGHGGVRLEWGSSAVVVTTSVGPRVLGLLDDGSNVMAVLPDAVLERPDGAPYRFYGGHRLWAAPEEPAVTYAPDDRPCAVTELGGGVRVEAPPDGAGLVKALEVRRHGDGWLVGHELRNEGDRPLHVAPWAITQLRPGGRATLPLGPRGAGPQADRALVLWPYTDLDDPRLAFAAGEVEVGAAPGSSGPVKVGAAPGEGRVSYRLGDLVFEKRVEFEAGGDRPDRGAAVQVFAREQFCELETLGPLHDLAPGASATHREAWTLRREAP